MDKESFHSLFVSMLDFAASDVDKRCSINVSRNFMIEFHGVGHCGSILSPIEAFELIYISDEVFHPLIDVTMKALHGDHSVVFIRVSDHSPATYQETWSPEDYGPFKLLEFDCAKLAAM